MPPDVSEWPPAASGRPTSIARSTPLAPGSILAPMAVIQVQRARSRDHFGSSKLSLRRWSALRRTSQPQAQFWPERLRSHFEALGTRYRTHLGMVGPRARPDRSKWLHGSPAESGVQARCRRLQLAAPCARNLRDTAKTLSEQVVIHTQAAPGSHWALPGTHGGGLGGRRSAPTADGRLRRMSRQGKGVNPFPPPIPLEGIGISESVPTPPGPSADRSRTSVGRVWMCTMDNHRLGPSARRRAHSRWLGTAPESTVDGHRQRGGCHDRSACSRTCLSCKSQLVEHTHA
jgi:hypothetical protein